MQEGIQPTWEAAENVAGGRWVIVFGNDMSPDFRTRLMNRFWLELVMCMVGEQFGDLSHLVNGIAFNNRHGKPAKVLILSVLLPFHLTPHFQLALWIKHGGQNKKQEEDIMKIG